jgi:hypothetical protein
MMRCGSSFSSQKNIEIFFAKRQFELDIFTFSEVGMLFAKQWTMEHNPKSQGGMPYS